jgi:pimeloyl-ACP methyl ester carboxylesterase
MNIDLWAVNASYVQIPGWVTPAEYCRWAESTPQPVAVVYGDSDGITPFFSSSKLLMQNLRQAQLTVVDNASHQVMQENPDTVNAVILDLLQKVRT